MLQRATSRFTIFLLFSFILTRTASAQLFFTPGYVVLATGDTLTGDLRDQGAHLIQFRPNAGAAIRSFTPEQITGYVADNTVRRSVHLTENNRDSTYFMYEQVNGYVGLYRLFSPEGRLTHALRLPSNTFVPLRGTLTLLTLTNNLTECSNPTFTRLLNPQSFRPLNADLERIVNAYNACVRPNRQPARLQPKKRFRYEAGVSVSFARNNWAYVRNNQSGILYYDPSGSYSPAYTAAVGAFFTIAPRKRLAATVELMGSRYAGDRLVPLIDPLVPNSPVSRLYSFSESYVSLPITGRYVFLDGPVRFYVRAGIGPTLTTIQDARFLQSDNPNPISINILNKTNIGLGYLVGIGANVLVNGTFPLYAELRAMPHSVLDGVTNIATSHSYQFNVSVPLVKHY